jgi:hypothetical protein
MDFFRGWISVSNLTRNSPMRHFTMTFAAKTVRIELLVTYLYQCYYYFECTSSHSESFLDDTQTDSMQY